MKKNIIYVLILVICASLTTGCASKYGPQQTEVNYYPACYDPIKKLREEEKRVNEAYAKGAAVGAGGGALLGLLIGKGKPETILASAVVGAAFGAIVNGQIEKARQIKDQNQRMATYLTSIQGNISNLNIQTTSAKEALQCYERQFKILMRSIKRKQVSREEAQRMFAEIESGTKEATKILGVLESNSQDMEKQYRAALATEEQELQKNNKKRSQRQVRATRKELRKVQKSCDSIQANTRKISNQKNEAEQRLLAQQMELKASFAEAEA